MTTIEPAPALVAHLNPMPADAHASEVALVRCERRAAEEVIRVRDGQLRRALEGCIVPGDDALTVRRVRDLLIVMGAIRASE